MLVMRSEAGSCRLPSFSLPTHHLFVLPRRVCPCAGFTLIEMMVTVAVALVLTLLAVPSFHHQLLTHRLEAVSQSWSDAYTTARMAAIRGNSPSAVCAPTGNGADSLGQACPAGLGAVVRLAGTQVVVVRAPMPGLDASLALHGDPLALRFDGNGLAHAVGQLAPYSGVVLDVCSPGLANDNHREIRLAAGSIVSVATTSGACP